MELSWADETKEAYISLKAIMNNGGYFKSYKQGQFLLKKAKKTFKQTDGIWSLSPIKIVTSDDPSILGMEIKKGQTGIWLQAIIGEGSWENGGWGRRARTIGWMFVIDEFGVERMYKVKFNHKLEGNLNPTARESVLQFAREDSDTSRLEAEKEIYNNGADLSENRAVSKYVGSVGDRVELEGDLEYITSVETKFGTSNLFLITDSQGNVYKYFGKNLLDVAVSSCSKEYKIKARFTIKKHEEYRGQKQTIINRPAKIKVFTSLAR
jgi:hypothetical protein